MDPSNKITGIPTAELEPDLDSVDLREVVKRLERAELQVLALKVHRLTLLETSLDGVMVVDSRGHILAANSHACQMFGYTHDELQFQIVEILVPEQQRAAHVHHRKGYNLSPKSRPMGQGIAMGLQGVRKDGSLFHIGISLNRVTIEGTPVICLVCTVL
jgi:PAS domain S-box-containing protein